jgi:predicted metal-dependent peptidase
MSAIKPIKKREIQDLGPLGGTREEIENKAASLVDTFGVICKIEGLQMVHSDVGGHTDCASFVAADFKDPEAYLTIEHELSHIFFESDLALIEEYRKIYVEDIFKALGYKLTSPEVNDYRRSIEKAFHDINNILEDHRVRSLWEEIYPGGGYYLKIRWENAAKMIEPNSLIPFIAKTCALGVADPTVPPEYAALVPLLTASKAAVELVNKHICIAETRSLIENCLSALIFDTHTRPELYNTVATMIQKLIPAGKDRNDLLRDQSPFQSDAALSSKATALYKMAILHKAVESMQNQGQEAQDSSMGKVDFSSIKNRVEAKDIGKIKQLVKMGNLASKGDQKAIEAMENASEEAKKEMQAKIEAAKAELAKNAKPSEEENMQQFKAATGIANIKPILIREPGQLPPPSKGADRIRNELDKIRMTKKRKLHEEGDYIDVEAFISHKIQKDLNSPPVYVNTTSEVGLELLILEDCSGSMRGAPTDMVDQAMADIKHAVKNLKVSVDMWAFSDNLYVYGKPGSIKNVGGGGTDLIPALDAAVEWAKMAKKTRAIIMITDGYPTSLRNRNSTGDAQKDMHNVIRDAQKDGIVIAILCIKDHGYSYVHCPCGKSSDWLPPNQSLKCKACGTVSANTPQAAYSELDKWFGANNYKVVSNSADIKVKLPQTAALLVANHLKRNL